MSDRLSGPYSGDSAWWGRILFVAFVLVLLLAGLAAWHWLAPNIHL